MAYQRTLPTKLVPTLPSQTRTLLLLVELVVLVLVELRVLVLVLVLVLVEMVVLMLVLSMLQQQKSQPLLLLPDRPPNLRTEPACSSRCCVAV